MLILGLGKFEFLAINDICPKIINTKYLGKIEFGPNMIIYQLGNLGFIPKMLNLLGLSLNCVIPKCPDFLGQIFG